MGNEYYTHNSYTRPCPARCKKKYVLCLNLYKIHWYNNIGKKSYFWPLVVIKYILNMNNISLGKTAPLLLVMGSHSQNPKTTKLKCLEQLLMMWEFRKGFRENGNNVGLWLVLHPYVWGQCFDFRLDDFASGRVRFCFGVWEILLLLCFSSSS